MVVVLIIIVLLFLGKKSVSTEVMIKASKEEVWSALSKASTIQKWNKVLIPLEGEVKEGTKVKYEFHQEENGKPSKIDATVIAVESYELINQNGGITLILTFNHKYIIEVTNLGTKVKIHEEYRGMMVPFWNPAPVELAYKRLLLQLKTYLENE